MAEISAGMVKELREKTQAGILDCKKALAECDGDMEKAIDFLRKKGMAKTSKLAGRIAAEGIVTAYIHGEGRIGVLVELNCETDFVARSPDFQQLAKDVAMQVAAANPRFVRREEVPSDVIEKEKEIYSESARQSGKPEKVIERIVAGMVDKFYSDVCLLEQPFIKDPDKKVQDHLAATIARIGENISIRRFTRYAMGEGLEKRADNFAEEVAAQAAMYQKA